MRVSLPEFVATNLTYDLIMRSRLQAWLVAMVPCMSICDKNPKSQYCNELSGVGTDHN